MAGMGDPATSKPPARFRLFPFLRTPQDVTPRQWRLLGMLGATVLINHYDFAILTTALLQIQQGLGVAEADVGRMVGVIRAGAILALPLSVVADRRGRRCLLIATILLPETARRELEEIAPGQRADQD
jgi:MFS family permease